MGFDNVLKIDNNWSSNTLHEEHKKSYLRMYQFLKKNKERLRLDLYMGNQACTLRQIVYFIELL